MKPLSITINGQNSRKDWGFSMSLPSLSAPQKKINSISIAGGTGDEYRDTGGYDDIPITLSFEAIDKISLPDKFRKVKNCLLSGFQINNLLIFSYDELWCYEVIYVENFTMTQDYLIHGNITISLICRPYMKRLDGFETSETIPSNTNYSIVTDCGGLPLIRIYSGKESITEEATINLTINKYTRTYKFKNYIDIDCEEEIIKLPNGNIDDSVYIYGDGYPELIIGDNSLKVDAGSFEITPRFRSL